ncbi:hypothetical protein FJZ19_00025 [Candidatus Pacearchaeota archaeon]|nr:hypothetical protein [Candidatus Pacearchaeota archaeon]
MSCLIKKIFSGKRDEQTHRQFVRFSRGSFAGRAALNLAKKEKIKLGGSFEFANDFVSFVAENSQAKFSGIILSKEDLGFGGKKKGEIFQSEVENIESAKIKEISDKVYSMLLDGEGNGISLKMKKKLPKPGKSGNLKIDDKFCILEADLKYWAQVKDFFMLPECKKAKISHTIIVEDIIIDKNEKDFARMRETARRKGKIVRKEEIDGKEEIKEIEFEA